MAVHSASRRPRASAKDRALGLLAVRWRSREELRRRLARAGFAPEEIEPALADLAVAGLIDDERFARELVRDRAGRRQAGSRAILSELRRQGVGGDVAEAAVAEAASDDQGRASAFAAARAGRLRGLPPETAYRRLVGALIRRGYGPSVARDAAREALVEGLPDSAEGAGDP